MDSSIGAIDFTRCQCVQETWTFAWKKVDVSNGRIHTLSPSETTTNADPPGRNGGELLSLPRVSLSCVIRRVSSHSADLILSLHSGLGVLLSQQRNTPESTLF
jgi:hypothetical protein